MSVRPAHPLNLPGDFYVEDGCCTGCDVPLVWAPELFEYTETSEQWVHCYVKAQPQTEGELSHMLNVIQCAELECIHYRGSDREIQSAIVDMGEGAVCDHLPPDLEERRREIETTRLANRPPADKIADWWYRLWEKWFGY